LNWFLAPCKITENITLFFAESDQQVSVRALLDNLTQPLINRWEPTRLAALRWICMLLTARADDMDVLLDELFPHLLRTLSDPSEPVVRLDLEALARIGSREQRFDTVLQQLVSLFLSDSKLLETRFAPFFFTSVEDIVFF
jgi:hypothetical protein